MEVDNDVENLAYEINYKEDGTTVKTDAGSGAIGTTIPVLTSFYVDGVKYFVNEGQPTSLTITKDVSNTLDITVRKAAQLNYTVVSSLGTTLASSSATEGEKAYVAYPKYELKGTDLYEALQNSASGEKYWVKGFTITSDNQEEIITYNKAVENIVFYSEAEDIEGATASNESNADARCSNAKGGYFPSDTKIATLSAGRYAISGQVWGGKEQKFTVLAGEKEIWSASTQGYLVSNTTEFNLFESTDIIIAAAGDKAHVLDYLYITRKGEPSATATIGENGFATFANHNYALDFSGVEGLTAYTATVSGKTITFAKATQVPAGTGVLLRGAQGSYDVPATATAAAVAGNALYAPAAAVTGLAYDADGYYNYILASVGGVLGFYQANNNNVAVGKAYLRVEKSPGVHGISFFALDDEATAIAAPTASETQGIVYDLTGRRVAAKGARGVYIVNGKKVIIK